VSENADYQREHWLLCAEHCRQHAELDRRFGFDVHIDETRAAKFDVLANIWKNRLIGGK